MRVFCLVLSFSLAISCGRKETPTTATTAPSAPAPVVQTAPPPPGWWIKDVTTGHEITRDGSIAPDKVASDFKVGEPVHISMNVSEAPPDSSITIKWYGPSDIVISEENKMLYPRQRTLSFSVPATYKWKTGTYRAEMWTGGQKAASQNFQIIK